MRMKKLLAAALACCTALSALPGAAVSAAGPEETAAPELLFDIQGTAGNSTSLSVSDLAKSDYAMKLKLYVPSNPGVNGISLKFQVNDGEVDENDAFHNYGFSLDETKLANPYCFDSENEGDSSKSFQSLFTADVMNLSWVYRFSQEENADSASEPGTTSWTSDVSWAYDKAFAEMTLTVPKGTPAGDYVLDVRRDPYVNSVTIGSETRWLAKSACTAANTDETVAFNTKPFTVHVVDVENLKCDVTAEAALTLPEDFPAFTVGDPLSLAGASVSCNISGKFSDGTSDSKTFEAELPEKCGTNKVKIGDSTLEHFSGFLAVPVEVYLDASKVDPTKPGTYPVTVTVEPVGTGEPFASASAEVTYAAETELTTSEETTTEITTTTESATTSEETTTAEITTTFDLRDLSIDALTAKLTLSKAATKTAYKVGEALSLSGMKVTADYATKFNDGSEVTKEKQAVTIPAKPKTAEKIRLGDSILLTHASGTVSAACEVYLDATAVNTKKAGTYPVKLTVEALGGEVLDTLSFDVTYEEEPAETTTEVVTTTTESVTTTTETTPEDVTMTTETTVSQAPAIENKYEGMAEGMYLVIGDVSGAPGTKVKVPVYVYNDPGTAGMSLYWVYSDGLKINRITDGDAYLASTQPSSKTVPISYVFTCPEGKNETAKDGAVICYITVAIPEDAKDGTVYKFEWLEEGGKTLPDVDKVSQACDTDGSDHHAKLFPGTVTVNAKGAANPRLNYASYSFTKKGETVKLAVLDAFGTGLRWSSTDESVATVDDNGMVTAAADTGDCTIQAEILNGSGEPLVLKCEIHIGLFGDVDGDGMVTAFDAQLVLTYFNEVVVMGFDPSDSVLTPEQVIVGDVDLDGELSAFDATSILTYFTLKYNAGFDDLTWYELIGNPDLPDAP